jgi:hypothetical protein
MSRADEIERYGRSAAFRDDVDHPMPSTDDITRFIFLQARFELAAESQKRLKRYVTLHVERI